ncbi:MAG TPA: hypothetical protein VG320_29395 [Paraburkholderia sp.]|nr:hypothetical protein [Paraburkholderia sp.]
MAQRAQCMQGMAHGGTGIGEIAAAEGIEKVTSVASAVAVAAVVCVVTGMMMVAHEASCL